jgi:L-aspartate oxidase
MQKHLEPRRYLVSFDTHHLPHLFTDVLVVGSGVAGLRAAMEAARMGSVLLVTKSTLADSNSGEAQGGVAAVMSPDDGIEAHVADTLRLGQGLADEQVVQLVISEGPAEVRHLIDWGAQFDRSDGELSLTTEGGHSHARIVHARGDATGAELVRTLTAVVAQAPLIQVLEHTFVIDLLTTDNSCVGAFAWDDRRGLTLIWAHACILATGGGGQVYRETTNPEVATGDGIALAYRAGAELRDLEFVQFHPTTLYIAGAARTLISETVRGEGGLLRNRRGERFMPRYHPDAELAPRDVVTRAILKEMQATGDTHVYLDLTHLAAEPTRERFPKIAQVCANFDIDITRDLIPVRPSAHYFVGGVTTDTEGRTNLEGLYAAGEVASTGLHGANRLGSNSLLEALVLGRRTGQAVGAWARHRRPRAQVPLHLRSALEAPRKDQIDLRDVANSLKSLMWRRVGIERDEASLAEAEERVDFWTSYVLATEFLSPVGWQLQNMLTVAKLITHCARERLESRGVHLRTDYPETDDVQWRRHITVQKRVPTLV